MIGHIGEETGNGTAAAKTRAMLTVKPPMRGKVATVLWIRVIAVIPAKISIPF